MDHFISVRVLRVWRQQPIFWALKTQVTTHALIFGIMHAALGYQGTRYRVRDPDGAPSRRWNSKQQKQKLD